MENVARVEKFSRILEIRVSVGKQSGVEPTCIEFCFSEVVRGSVLEGAKLVMEISDGRDFRVIDLEVA